MSFTPGASLPNSRDMDIWSILLPEGMKLGMIYSTYPLVNQRISALYLSGCAKYLVSSTAPINAVEVAIPQVGQTSYAE